MRRALGGILAVLWGIVASGCAPARSALPYYDSSDFTPHWQEPVEHRLGPFNIDRLGLRTQVGTGLSYSDLKGRIHVASFIFTSCSTLCPQLVTQLERVQAAFAGAPDVLLVSYSVTPWSDTPEVLAQFGREHGIDPATWLLVTGPADSIYTLARAYYFADDGRLDAGGDSPTFLHTEKFLLVDGSGRLRGVYNGTQPSDVARLMSDVATLRTEASTGA